MVSLFTELFNFKSLGILSLYFISHIISISIIIFVIYYSTYRRKNFVFTFFLIGTIVFLVSYAMSTLELNMGFALGLFAIFGIIRYRTDLIPTREMTYLFIIIGLSIINSITKTTMSLIEIVALNIFVMGAVFVFEKLIDLKTESFKVITYDKLELIKPGNEQLFIQDIKERFGLSIERFEIVKINATKNMVTLKMYYHSKKGENGNGEMIMDDGDDD